MYSKHKFLFQLEMASVFYNTALLAPFTPNDVLHKWINKNKNLTLHFFLELSKTFFPFTNIICKFSRKCVYLHQSFLKALRQLLRSNLVHSWNGVKLGHLYLQIPKERQAEMHQFYVFNHSSQTAVVLKDSWGINVSVPLKATTLSKPF